MDICSGAWGCRGNPVSTKVVNRGKSWFSPSHRMQSACFISSQALLSCGALERARSSLKLALE